ncbi:hypothetical protein D3C87_1579940 [compost metagenome]
MPGVRDRMELCARNQLLQGAPAFDGNPLIVFAPENLHRAANRRVQALGLAGVALVHLGDLPIKRRLPRITQPRLHIGCEFIVGDFALDRSANVSRHDGSLNVVGQPTERRFMLTHVLHERRAPGRQCHRVDQCQAAVILAVQKMRAQDGSAAKVVGHHVGVIQAPVFQQLCQQLVLHAQ